MDRILIRRQISVILTVIQIASFIGIVWGVVELFDAFTTLLILSSLVFIMALTLEIMDRQGNATNKSSNPSS